MAERKDNRGRKSKEFHQAQERFVADGAGLKITPPKKDNNKKNK